MKPQQQTINYQPIAIIGMGCLFPKSSDLKAYWRLLFHGEDAITQVPDSHWLCEDYFDDDPKKPDHVYCKRGGFISPVSFDPVEFGIPPTSLEATDTSQLLGLMVAKRALEDAGYGDNRGFKQERTSVILGVTGTQELVIPLGARLGHPAWRKALENSGISPEKIEKIVQDISDSYVSWQENSFPGLLGNVVAGRISNRLDLGGTNCVVDAACASSFSAIHLAAMELMTKRCDMVVTGGVDTLNDIFMHMCFAKTMVLSPTGDIRPFSKDADGTILGEGIGMFVLKRLEDAENHGDRIYGVIKGIGSSSDGKSQSIYAPRAEGQAKALQMAYTEADFEPSTVEFVEAHGTGTQVGDAVEFQALNRLFGKTGENGRWCALGSVKSMIGHTKAAAGAAGLMKAVLSLHNKVLLPTIKVDEPDPKLNIDQSPFYLNTSSRPWFSKENHPRRSGISAFGFGGSNFHIVVEEYRKQKPDVSWDGAVEIVALSNSNQKALKKRLLEFKIAVDKSMSYDDISEKAERTRDQFSASDPHRLLLVVERSSDIPNLFNRAVHALEANAAESPRQAKNIFYGGPDQLGKLAFVFPGQGSQYVNMGRDLVCCFPEAFDILELANQQYENAVRLTDSIYPQPAQNSKERNFQEARLRKTDLAQPAIGSVSVAMLKVLHRFGIQPDATCGHSFGELTALFAAGWIDLETLVYLSITRGQVMAAVSQDNGHPKGGMLAVKAPIEKLADLIRESNTDVILANRNSPQQGVLSGPANAIEAIQAVCEDRGFRTTPLPVSAAFHSHLVKDAQEPFIEILAGIDITPTDIPVFSNTTGEPYPADSNKAKHLLGQHLLCPVDFVSEIENAFATGVQTFVEIGPKSVLTSLIRSILKDRPFLAMAMDDSSGRKSGIADLARTVCRIASMGHFVDLKHWEQPGRKQRKEAMSIPISGTNYRKPAAPVVDQQSADGSGPASKNRRPKTEKQVHKPKHMDLDASALPPDPTNTHGDTMNKDKEKHHHFFLDALKVVQEGLNSMQALQIQTAKTHQKFLETQTEASRALQKMMEHTQRLAAASFGYETEAKEVDLTYETARDKPSDSAITDTPVVATASNHPSDATAAGVQPPQEPSVPSSAAEPPTTTLVQEAPYPTNHEDVNPVNGDPKKIDQDLLEIVSQLTGYPIEMLDLGMDIEADLGIDSITRVDILSALEEKISTLPSISPEIMGSIKTLGQIIDYLEDASDSVIEPESKAMAGPDQRLIESSMLESVSQLTGYPIEMLELDMNIEADLGIDSIKRVEILSSLEEKIPNLPTLSPEIMGEMKTLGQIAGYLSNTSTKDPSPYDIESLSSTITDNYTDKVETISGVQKPTLVDVSLKDPSYHIERNVVSCMQRPLLKNDRLPLPANRKIYVTEDNNGLAKAIASRFNSMNIDTVIVSCDRSSSMRMETKDLQKAAGLIILSNKDHPADRFLKDAFLLAQRMAPGLLESGSKEGALFATITRLDGAFGFKGQALTNPLQGGLAGLSKTAALEWENVSCHALDISPLWKDNDAIASAVVDELLYPAVSDPIEIGLDEDTRWVLALEPADYPRGNINIDQGEVVVVSGGARGITASTAYALTKHAKPTLVVLGRSATPIPEPDWLVSLEGEGIIKKAILENDFNGQKTSPPQLEKAYKEYMANREITNSLNRIQQLGSNVRYYGVDVRDIDQVKKALDDVRSVYGPVKGIIHGAGVLEDRWIVDKTLDQFDKVFDTKVKGLNVLLEATQHDELKYLVLFSSVAARFGNNGQVDYAMANEVLNKIAQQESITRPDCKVISINWGPWDGGMVCSALKQKFKNNGISLISEDAGAMCMVYEMMGDKNQPVEVVIGANMVCEKKQPYVQHTFQELKLPVKTKEKEKLSLTLKREIDIERVPILESHILDGKPVVPFALITEWLGHGALYENPGLFLHGLEDMRILQGIKLDQKKKVIRLMAGKTRRKDSIFEVDVEIRDGIQHDIETIHSKATAILTDKVVHPPLVNPAEEVARKTYPRSIDEIYEKILFHGVELRGIQEIIGYSSKGIVAKIAAAPSPSFWMSEPLRNQWIGDPLVLDSAFQIAILWCFEERNMVSLPNYTASYRQYRSEFPTDGTTVVFEVNEINDRKMRGTFTFLDNNSVVVAQITGYEGVIDGSLYRAFKPQYAA
ncbi:MAG: SDR family NAD(P)-dependent oxidoreductase [Desulfobacterales bacterium]|nr:MAG: SDR family NAD(P)-dependent oxidoreductase [Desulfobacterales bacterium]